MDAPEPIDAMAVTDAAADLFLRLGRSTPLDASVLSCPGWSLADLLFHAGGVVQFWAQMAQGVAPGDERKPVRPDDADVVDWLEVTFDEWIPVLAALDPSGTASFSLTDDQSVAFVQRRVAHELTIHAWDAAVAAGLDHEIEPAVAVDGVDEYFDVWLSSPFADRSGAVQSLHLHATDLTGEWHVTVGEDALVVTHEHAKGDVAVRATASDLLLLLWGRVELDSSRLEVFGGQAELVRFLARVAA